MKGGINCRSLFLDIYKFYAKQNVNPNQTFNIINFFFLPVPDPPERLQLSYIEEYTITARWSPPANAHGLIREYVVSLHLYVIKLLLLNCFFLIKLLRSFQNRYTSNRLRLT